jgi:hypothetical protein
MMTIDEALYAYLTGPTTNSYQLMGDRLYPLNLPQNPTYPAATYQQITSQLTATGQSAPGDLENPLIQFDCYALSHKQARLLAKAIRADLSGFKGDMAGLPVTCHFQNEWDFWGAEAEVWRVTLEFRLLFNI